MDGFPSGQRGQTVNLLATLSKVRILLHPLGEESLRKSNNAGWSSLEARRAHNPKVVGSNPAPAISFVYMEYIGFFCYDTICSYSEFVNCISWIIKLNLLR